MANPAAIETEDLQKTFHTGWRRRPVHAVAGVSLRVEAGSAFGLLGANGAGKTTFVKMLLSATRPTAGSARLFGRPAAERDARLPIGYLPENHRFPTYLTGRGLLDLSGALSGLSAAERRRRIPPLLDRVGLGPWGDVRLGKYSKGMLQRAGIAQAMLHRPRLLLLDEPTDGVDPVGRIEIRRLLDELRREGVTLFVNSHLLSEIEMTCDRVAILHRGRVAREGTVAALTEQAGYLLTAAGDEPRRFPTLEEANRAIDALRAAGRPVERLERSALTLEEVFVRVVEGQ